MAKHTASVISIGDELLRGQVVNTNSAFIAAHLHCAGYKVLKIITLPDDVSLFIIHIEFYIQNYIII